MPNESLEATPVDPVDLRDSDAPLSHKGKCIILQDFHGVSPFVSGLVVSTILTMGITLAGIDYLNIDPDAPVTWWGFPAMLLMVAVFLVVMIASFALGWWLWEKLFPKQTGYYGETHWYAGPDGLHIDLVCQLPWSHVLATEPIPDDDTHMLIHSVGHGTLMLDLGSATEWEAMHQLIHHYLAASKTDGMIFRAQVFHWPRFFCWILAGYILPAVMLYYALPENNKGFLGVLAIIFVVAPILAWLIWSIPTSFDLGIMGGRKMRAFRCVGHTLYCLEDQRVIDLHAVRIKHRWAWWGGGPKFDFVSVLPKAGKRLDLIPEDGDAQALYNMLKHMAEPNQL